MTLTLRYDPALAAENTWRVTDRLDAVEVRAKVASAPELSFTIELRYRRDRKQAPLSVQVRPMDADLDAWATESGLFHPDMPRLSLVLRGATVFAAEVMQQW
jgi:hypothetical protein